MPHIWIATRDLRLLRRELKRYGSEVRAMVEAYRSASALVGFQPDDGLPEALSEELNRLEFCQHILASADIHLNLRGIDAPVEVLAIFSTVLVLYRDHLEAEYIALASNPLTPDGAASPVSREVQRLDDEFRTTWDKWGRAAFHEIVLRRTLLRGGRMPLSPDARAKVWCVVDTNLFLQYQLFDQVDWATVLETGPVVLVVPTAVLRALDRYKSDVERPRLRARARTVLPLLERYTLNAEPRQLAPVRPGVDLLLLDREPPMPTGLDPADPDDRIIASALDLRDRWIGSQVMVLSGDTTVRIKARSWGLGQASVPPALRLRRYAEGPSEPASRE